MTTDRSSFPATPSSPEDRDALLTALALGELTGPELDEAERLLADPHATSQATDLAHVAEVRRIAAALRAAAADEPAERSATLRRAVLAALAAGPAAAAHERDRDTVRPPVTAAPPHAGADRGPRRRSVGVVAGLVGLAAAAVVAVTFVSQRIGPHVPAAPVRREIAQVEALSRLAVPATAETLKQKAPGDRGRPEESRLEEREVDALLLGESDARGADRGALPSRRLAREEKVPIGQPAADKPTGALAARPLDGPANRIAEAANGLPALQQSSAPAAAREGALRLDETLRAADTRRAGTTHQPDPMTTPTGETWFGDEQRTAAKEAAAPLAAAAPLPAAPLPAAPLPAAAPAPVAMAKAAATAEKETLGLVPSQPVEALGTRERSARDLADVDADLARGNVLAERQRQGELRADREGYAPIEENPFVSPSAAPLSTFSIDVDTASYANVRRFLAAGRLPPRDAVRIEELVNYFSYELPQPVGDAPFSVTVEATGCPWAAGRRLVRVALQGRTIDRRSRPAGNLVFLVDVSGSMRDADKLPLVKQALTMLVEELGEDDRVAIVTYAGDAGLALPPTGGERKERILAAIAGLAAGGSTHGSAGIELAYEQAAAGFIPGGVNRVILATDGDLNVGITDDAALVELIRRKAAGGTFLTVLGVGTGNLQDAKMEKLADNGNGVYAYLDGVREARKVLVEQLVGSTITIAKDVKIQVEFNPARVASYRLIGYENRVLAAADFRDDRKDAGEIGAGHAVTALYEIVPAGAPAPAPGGAEPLKYGPRPDAAATTAPALPASAELLTAKLRFKQPDRDTSTLLEVPLTDAGGGFAAAPADFRFAAAVAAFGMRLRGSVHAGTATFADVATIAAGALGPDAGGYRAEFLDLVRKAADLATTAPRD